MLGKKLSVYDSQIWCQQGRAFVRSLAAPPERGGLQYEKKKWNSCPSQSGHVSRFICPLELVCTKFRLHFAAIWRATKLEKNISFQNTKAKRLTTLRQRQITFLYLLLYLILAMRFQSMESDLTVIQNFLDQCHNRRFISFPVYQEPFK